MSELITEMPKCPVCGNATVRGVGDGCHCGQARLLSKVEDHYLSFSHEPSNGWPKKGCPICGRPMQEAGKFHFLTFQARLLIEEGPKDEGEGLERMRCDQSDHYCYVTKAWYNKNRSRELPPDSRKGIFPNFDSM